MGLQFLTSAWLFALPAFLGALVLLYFLKLKRREVTISSTYLWRQALDDMRVNSPLQKLRMNLLLFLQALALILVILALARPVSHLGSLAGQDAILLVDVSASMKTTDGGDGLTRFERAVEGARQVVEDMSGSDRAILIAFSDDARVLTSLTDSKHQLLEALDALEATDRPTRLSSALHRVRALLADAERDPQIYVFSDGAVGSLDEVPLEESIPLHYMRTGSETDNVGIVGIDVRMGDVLMGADNRVLVTLQNSGAEPVELGVDFYLDDALLGSKSVTVEGAGVASIPFDTEATAGRLRVELDHNDPFPSDDVAYALLRPLDMLRVLLVTEGNLFLVSALQADEKRVWRNPRGEVPVMLPAAFDAEDQSLLDYDMIVLDRCQPPVLPSGNYLIFGAAPPFEGFQDLGEVRDVKVLDWDESHEVARFVNFATLVLPVAHKLEPREGDTVIVRGSQGPIVIEARERDVRTVTCSFDLLSLPIEGAWTFDPSFPIFLANATRWLGGGGQARRLLVRTGGTAELRFPHQAVRAVVDPPDLEARELEIREGDDALRVTGLDTIGVYSATFYKADSDDPVRSTMFTANLTDAAESLIAPAETLELPGRDEPIVGTTETVDTHTEVWKLVAAIALAFVLLEWWIYNRRVFI